MFKHERKQTSIKKKSTHSRLVRAPLQLDYIKHLIDEREWKDFPALLEKLTFDLQITESKTLSKAIRGWKPTTFLNQEQ